ncbi:hypothetical protein [Sedimentisphaera cyanobacteriorum]|uniref:hypothetical protein n=1 Tax=Sedimentisphaera cyanobacteriorum TaxID=1940790 RepID=UPI000F51344E|nr:hypothetical protein [Sedimentisphaera cyanobacteriorum]
MANSVNAERLLTEPADTLSGWTEDSQAANEAGDDTGGIRASVMNGEIIFQLNSWWDGAESTQITKSTSIAAEAGEIYCLTAEIESYSAGKPVTLALFDAGEPSETLASKTIHPETGGFRNFQLCIDTNQNPEFIGKAIGIKISSGSQNNVGIRQIHLDSGRPAAAALRLFTDPADTLSAWAEDSNAESEAGDDIGGIRTAQINGDMSFRLNSWWDGAKRVKISRSTDAQARSGTIYSLTAEILSYDNSDPVELKIFNADNPADTIASKTVYPSTQNFSKCEVRFDTAEKPDLAGKTLGIEINPGWWNNLAVRKVYIDANPPEANTVYFSSQAFGEDKPLDYWGTDQTWITSNNMDAALENLGSLLDVVRISSRVIEPLTYDGGEPQLPDSAKNTIDSAMAQAGRAADAELSIMLLPTDDHHEVADWYISGGEIIPDRWVDALIAAINYVNSTYGYTMSDWAFVEVFNEPDWDWPVATKSAMADIMAEYRTRPELDSIPLLGPSTLSSNSFESWYSATAQYTDICGTHVINGSLDSLIWSVTKSHEDGKPFLNPEIHNIVELMVQANCSDHGIPGEGGIYWGEIDETRGVFSKAIRGKRLGYKTHASTWTAGCVYRDLQQRVWAFAAGSERNALPSKWKFRCMDRDVFFNGEGPARSWEIDVASHTEKHLEVAWSNRCPDYFTMFMKNDGRNLRLDAENGNIDSEPVSYSEDSARWEFVEAGAFYYIDNIDLSSDKRLAASSSTGQLILSDTENNQEYAKWQLLSAGDNYYLENVGLQRQADPCRLIIDSSGQPGFAPSSVASAQTVWNLQDAGAAGNASPAAPYNLTAEVIDEGIELSWQHVQNPAFAGYNIYRLKNNNPIEEIAAGLQNKNFIDTDVVELARYRYFAAAENLSGVLSSFSNQAALRPRPFDAVDDFESGDFSGGTGWNGSWTASGSASVASLNGNSSAKITGGSNITRELDPEWSWILSFKYDADLLAPGEWAAAEIYDFADQSWRPVWKARYFDNALDSSASSGVPDGLQEAEIRLADYGYNVSQIRFITSSTNQNGCIFIDDVKMIRENYDETDSASPWSDALDTTSGWNEVSLAPDEPGDETGGIQIIEEDGEIWMELYSWGNGSKRNLIWKDTSAVVQPDTEYYLRVRAKNRAGKGITLTLQNADTDSDIVSQKVYPPQDGYADVSVYFSSKYKTSAVGHPLAVYIDAGWWNRCSLQRALIEAKDIYHTGDLNQSRAVDLEDFCELSSLWQAEYFLDDLKETSQDWLKISD